MSGGDDTLGIYLQTLTDRDYVYLLDMNLEHLYLVLKGGIVISEAPTLFRSTLSQ